MSANFAYRAFDESSWGIGVDPDEILAALADELLATGDLDAALARLARTGMELGDGRKMMGLREMIERLRAERAALINEGDPDGEVARLRERLNEIVSIERASLDELDAEARRSGDERRAAVTDEVVTERRLALDLMGEDLAGRIDALRDYEFTSSEAREAFDAFMAELRSEVADTYTAEMKEALASQDPAELARLGEAFAALNSMLERDARAIDVSEEFDSFMERYGDLFPGAKSLDELVDQLAARMAAASSMLASLSPTQRDELRAAMRAVLQDASLLEEMDRLAYNLAQARPDLNWERTYVFEGRDALSISKATDLAEQLGQLDALEDLLGAHGGTRSLGEVDVDAVQRLLGQEVASSLSMLSEMIDQLRDAGLIDQHGATTTLTPRGVRRLGSRALADIFSGLGRSPLGEHRVSAAGRGHDREETTRPFEFGDPFTLDLSATVHNAIRRGGGGVPVGLSVEDFEVVETESLARAATVLCVDLSMSMPMRDNFVPAKKMALALHSLISSRYPRDFFALVGFSEVAREIKPAEFPSAMWDYVYGTNLQHALGISRSLLAHRDGARQIIVVTDGEPTAHIGRDGLPHFHYPPLPETLERTMAEVVACTRAGITINVFALDVERTMFPFIEQIARVNGGRTFATTPGDLGGYVLVDFLANRRVRRLAG